MVAKHGWVRITEAVIAVLIVIGFLIFLYINNSDRIGKSRQIYNIERSILDEIEGNSSMRDAVLNFDINSNEISKVENFIGSRLSGYPSLDFEIVICSPEEACGLSLWPEGKEEVYAEEILITSNLENYKPKKLKLFVWEK